MPLMNRRVMLGQACSLGSLPLEIPPEDAPPRRQRKVTVTGGHPGDPECGCGGTIAHYSDLGDSVVLLYLNDGVPAGKPRDGVRVAEAQEACAILKSRP